MTKIRKYKGSYTIPIHKHTKVRRPKSKWVTNIFANYEVGDSLYFGHLTPIKVGDYVVKVQDISKGLENPLYVGSDFMEAIRNPKITSTYPEIPQYPARNWGQIKRKVKIKKRYTLSPNVLNLTDEAKKWQELNKILRKKIRKYAV